jgi:uncharacterized OB-fold protein
VTGDAPAPGKYLARELHPAARSFYDRLAGDGRPSTTRCASCEVTSFPPRERCPGCGAAQEWVALPERGRLHAFTTQEGGLRFRAPTVLALAEVGEVVLPGVMDVPYESLRIGDPVSVGARIEPDTGLPVIEFRAHGD